MDENEFAYVIHSDDGFSYRYLGVHRTKAEAMKSVLGLRGFTQICYRHELLEVPFPISGIDLENLPEPFDR